MARSSCLKCQGPIAPQSGRHQPRKYCTTCRPPRDRKAVRLVEPTVSEIRPGASREVSTVVEATERRLRELGRLGDPSAMVVLQLARSIDKGGHSGASLASLSREFRAAMAEAVTDAAPAAADDDGVSWGLG